MKKTFQDFCTSTSLHGWSHLTARNSPFRQFYWLGIILMSTSFAGYMVWINLDQFVSSTVEIRLKTTIAPLSESLYPKITICNSYKLRNSFLDEAFDPKVLGIYQSIQMKHAFTKEFLTGYEEHEAVFLNLSSLYEHINSPGFIELMNRECPYTLRNMTCSEYTGISNKSNTDQSALLITSRQTIYSMVLQLKIQQTSIYDPLNTKNAQVAGTEDNLCFSIQPDASKYRMESGFQNGLEVLLDAEVFENGDPENPFSGFDLLVNDENAFSLMGRNGFSTPVGRSIKINIRPEIHEITSAAKKRFTSDERMCIYEGEFKLEYRMNYSLSACIALAALDQMLLNCGENVSHDIVHNKGVGLFCYHKFMKRVGAIKYMTLEDRFGVPAATYCQKACDRQDIIISASQQTFPSPSFSETADFWLVVRKLYWSCIDSKSKFGYKRPRIYRKYPNICQFFDNYIYLNKNITHVFENFNVTEFLHWQKEHMPLDIMETILGINKSEKDLFIDAILEYCKDNLVHIIAYIGEPFMSVYVTDEKMSPITLVANMGGLLGLCMGFSLVSIAEVLYQLLVSPFLNWIEKKTGIKKTYVDYVEDWRKGTPV